MLEMIDKNEMKGVSRGKIPYFYIHQGEEQRLQRKIHQKFALYGLMFIRYPLRSLGVTCVRSWNLDRGIHGRAALKATV
jgi:hypothetical protein